MAIRFLLKLFRKLWSHMVATIENFVKEREKNILKGVTNKSNYIIYTQDKSKELYPYVMELFYITYGVIPFLSQFCEISVQSRSGKYCVVVELQSIRNYLLVSK